MATKNVFFDDTATGANDGTSTDDAYTTFTPLKSVMVAGDFAWVRRTMLEDNNADFDLTDDGDPDNPITVAGWPRASKATTGNFTNGSRSVSNIASADMSHFQHAGRNLTGPDGAIYTIAKITNATTVIIGTEYVGTTSVGGSFTLSADDYYTEAQAIDDSAWTTKLATWNADPDTVPGWNFTAAADFNPTSDYHWEFYNVQWVGNDKTLLLNPTGLVFKNCYFDIPTHNRSYGTLNNSLAVNCILRGNSAVSNFLQLSKGAVVKNCHFDAVGAAAAQLVNTGGTAKIINCTCQTAPGTAAFYFAGVSDPELLIKDCYTAAGNLFAAIGTTAGAQVKLLVENYQQIYGDNRKSTVYGSAVSNDGSGADVNLRSGGASHIVDILNDKNIIYSRLVSKKRPYNDLVETNYFMPYVFEHRIWQTDLTSKTYRYYVQSVTDALTDQELWLEIGYPSGYDDSTEYLISLIKSDEAITARDDADDWDQYVEAACTCAVAGWVTLRVYCTKYHATNHRYIDPKVVVS